MAIVKHIKSRNANYSDALNYLIFQHDESTGKMILDEFNRPLRRDELYVDGLNCNPDTFDVECYECNEHFKKNRSRSEIKSHHYIISFDPDDKSECGLTGEKAQALYNHCNRHTHPALKADPRHPINIICLEVKANILLLFWILTASVLLHFFLP